MCDDPDALSSPSARKLARQATPDLQPPQVCAWCRAYLCYQQSCPRRGAFMRFEGTKGYVATDDLKVAVNASITLERPLLVKGEPGTGKTVLALEIAKALNAPLIEWHIKSTTKALQGLYEYDAVSRL